MAIRFDYNPEVNNADKEQRTKLRNELKLAVTEFVETLSVTFSELFTALMHLKVMRAYIDAILRFGIPPKFFMGIVAP